MKGVEQRGGASRDQRNIDPDATYTNLCGAMRKRVGRKTEHALASPRALRRLPQVPRLPSRGVGDQQRR
ncbi:MAG: hypothetical protein ACO2PN_07740 [Pyrobaculum sp.]